MINNSISSVPRVLITMGEPAGIGPELIVKIAQLDFAAELIVIADEQLLVSTAKHLNLPLELVKVDWNISPRVHSAGKLLIVPVVMPVQVIVGQLNPDNAQATLDILTLASDLAQQGKVDAIVTAPVHKANLNYADKRFLGHTEFFALCCDVQRVVMMLASGELRITLATTHLPLSQVSQAITAELLTETIDIILTSFELWGLPQPKIAVCGLNPHAGEDGLLGREEIEIIQPVIQNFAQAGKLVYGPFPADTLFTSQHRSQYDVFLAMFHDQGLPVVKSIGFGECANVTLGLPYIRTSVDHGTALDIAPSYTASADSLAYAINYALTLASGSLPQ